MHRQLKPVTWFMEARMGNPAKEPETLEEYFDAHPDELDEWIDEMARLEEESFVDFPEDYTCK